MVGVAVAAPKHLVQHNVEENLSAAQAEAPRFERVTWYKEPHLRKLYLLSIFLMIASATTGYDGMMVNTSQQMDAWNNFFPEHTNANKLGILINMYSIGSIVSFFIVPYLADKVGRKPTIIAGCLIMILGALISAFCNGYGMYIAGRFVLGFGNSLAQMCSPLLLTEICHPQHRGPLTAVYNCLWNAGSLLVSIIGWGTVNIKGNWSWRSITFIQAVPSMIQLCGIWFVPESPRFLVNKDRSEEALAVLAKYHGGGDANNTTVQFQYREIKSVIEADRDANQSTKYIDFFRTKGNRWRLAIIVSLGIVSQYSGNAIISNYINTIYAGAGITGQNRKLGLSCGKTILDLCITIYCASIVDKVGRRPLFLASITGMVISFTCWTVTAAVYENSGYAIPMDQDTKDGTPDGMFYSNKGSGYAQIAFVWLFGVSYDLAMSGLLVAYAIEVLPFHLRAKGMMIMNISTQAILALGNQTNLVAWNNLPHHWNLPLFYTLWDCVELVFVYFFYVETKGPTLEEIARIFDGEDAVVHLDLEQVEKEVHLHSEHIIGEKSAA